MNSEGHMNDNKHTPGPRCTCGGNSDQEDAESRGGHADWCELAVLASDVLDPEAAWRNTRGAKRLPYYSRVYERFTTYDGRVEARWVYVILGDGERRFVLTEEDARAAIARAKGESK